MNASSAPTPLFRRSSSAFCPGLGRAELRQCDGCRVLRALGLSRWQRLLLHRFADTSMTERASRLGSRGRLGLLAREGIVVLLNGFSKGESHYYEYRQIADFLAVQMSCNSIAGLKPMTSLELSGPPRVILGNFHVSSSVHRLSFSSWGYRLRSYFRDRDAGARRGRPGLRSGARALVFDQQQP